MSYVYWIQNNSEAHLAIVACPRGEDWLDGEVLALKSSGIDILVSLLEPDEALDLGLTKENELAQKAGLEFISFPIPDRATPENRQNFCQVILYLAEAIRSGKHVGAHCRGCIGRSTVLTASILIELGWSAAEALRQIEKARGCSVPDTEEQRHWILQFSPCSHI